MKSLILLVFILTSASSYASEIPCNGAISVISQMERDLQNNNLQDESKEVFLQRDQQLFQKLKSNMQQYCYAVDQRKNQQQQH